MSVMALSPDGDDFEEISQKLRQNAENLVEFAKGNQSYIDKLITFIAGVREANHFEEGIYKTMTERSHSDEQEN